MTAIWKRELQSYFFTPVGYVFMGVFFALAGVMFNLVILTPRSGDLLTFIGEMSYLWMLLCPVLTMRLFAEERQKRTDQLLLTSPVSLPGIVLGKYAAALTVLLATVLLTGLYAGIIALYGRLWAGEVFVGYLGFVLQGCAIAALDLYLSAVCPTPVVAAIAALGCNFVLWMLDMLADTVTVPFLAEAMTFLSLYSRNEPFLMGQLSFASVAWDLSFALACLALTLHALERRRRGD